MNVQEMRDGLGLRLNDAAEKVFTGKYKHQALSNGQIIVAHLLNNGYLTELETLDSNESATSGSVAFSNLSESVLRGAGGILNIKNYNGKHCAMLNFPGDLKDNENSYLAGDTRQPKAWIFEEAVKLYPTTLTAIDAYYMKMPSPLLHPFVIGQDLPYTTNFTIDADQEIVATNNYYNNAPIWSISNSSYHIITAFVGSTLGVTVSPATGGTFGDNQTFYFVPTKDHDFHLTNLDAVTCDLDASLHDLVVTFAEAECWKMKREHDRSRAALNKAVDTVNTLNENYEAAEGIGTQGRR